MLAQLKILTVNILVQLYIIGHHVQRASESYTTKSRWRKVLVDGIEEHAEKREGLWTKEVCQRTE